MNLVPSIIRRIDPFCRVVGDFGPKDALKNVFAIKHEHAGNEEPRIQYAPQTLISYIGQQMEVYCAQDAITDVVGVNNTRFLLEGVCRDPAEYFDKVIDALTNYPLSAQMYIQHVLAASGISDIGQIARDTSEKVQRLFAEGKKTEAADELKRAGGGFELA